MTLPNEPQPAETDQAAPPSGWTPVPGSAPIFPGGASTSQSPFGPPPSPAPAGRSATGPRIVGGGLAVLGALGVWWGGPALGAMESSTVDVFGLNPLRLMAGFFGPLAVIVGLGALAGGSPRKGRQSRPDALSWLSLTLMTVLGIAMVVWGWPGVGDLIASFSDQSYAMPRVRISSILAVALGGFAALAGASSLIRLVRGG